MTPTNPMWVPANIEFNDKVWTNVGIRFKGNSSLRSSWGSGTDKMPFKFDFDQFEADYPDIKNQRFYGFKQLSVNPNFSDASNIRETVAYDLLADAGLVAAETGFYEVVLDRGQGRQSLGLYTFVENIDDTVVKRTFKQADGNIYEGDGAAASLASGTLDRIPDSFQVESDKAKADWSDIKALYNALHAADRTTNPANWRKNLEATFDVDVFLKWLGLSATMQHWDTYGAMSHNFYLYNDPATKKLTWISWDHNQILGSGGGGMVGVQNGQPVQGIPGQQVIPGGPGGNQGGAGGRGNVSIDQKSVGTQWPLIRFLMDDPTYYATYVAYLKETMNVFAPDKLEAKYQAYATVLAPTVAKTGDVTAFQNAITSLTTTTRTRYQLVQDFLKTA